MTFCRIRCWSGWTGANIWPALVAALLGGCVSLPEPATIEPWLAAESLSQRSLAEPGLVRVAQDGGIEWPPSRWSLDELLFAAGYFSAELKRIDAEREASRARGVIAMERRNPFVELPVEYNEMVDDDEESHWLAGIVMSFTLRDPRKAQLEFEQSLAAETRLLAERDGVSWSLRRSLRDGLLQGMRLTELAAANAEQREAVARLVALLEQSSALGQGRAFELAQARLEQRRLELEAVRLRGQLREVRVALAAALDMPATAMPQEFLGLDPPDDVPFLSLRESALTERSDLRVVLASYVEADAALRRTLLNRIPDLTLTPGYVFDQGDQIWSLTYGALLPLLSRPRGQELEAQANVAAVAARFEDLQAGIINEVERQRAVYLATRETLAVAEALVDTVAERVTAARRRSELGFRDQITVARIEFEALLISAEVLAARWAVMQAVAAIEDSAEQPLFRPSQQVFLVDNLGGSL